MRYGYQGHSSENLERIFFSCCVLHNMLLTFDQISTFDAEDDNDSLNNWIPSAQENNNNNALINSTSRNNLSRLAEQQIYEARGRFMGEGHIQSSSEHFELRSQLVQHYKQWKIIND